MWRSAAAGKSSSWTASARGGPGKGRQIPLGEVADYGSARAREYGGMINADPYQGVVIIQKWREAGHQVKAATFNPLANSRRASLLLYLIRERQIDLPEDEQELFHEITSPAPR